MTRITVRFGARTTAAPNPPVTTKDVPGKFHNAYIRRYI